MYISETIRVGYHVNIMLRVVYCFYPMTINIPNMILKLLFDYLSFICDLFVIFLSKPSPQSNFQSDARAIYYGPGVGKCKRCQL